MGSQPDNVCPICGTAQFREEPRIFDFFELSNSKFENVGSDMFDAFEYILYCCGCGVEIDAYKSEKLGRIILNEVNLQD